MRPMGLRTLRDGFPRFRTLSSSPVVTNVSVQESHRPRRQTLTLVTHLSRICSPDSQEWSHEFPGTPHFTPPRSYFFTHPTLELVPEINTRTRPGVLTILPLTDTRTTESDTPLRN